MTKLQDSNFAPPTAARFGNCSRHCPTSCILAVEGGPQGGAA